MTNKVEVNIAHIYSSPEHHYFTREKFDVGNALTYEYNVIELEVGRGIKDDRFEFSKYPLTFVSEEVMKEVCMELELPYEPKLFRRNVVVSGINLNQLISKTFTIGDLVLEGMEHCAPCTWMNSIMKKGAYKLMIGRGGLRVRVLQSGTLKTGTNTLITQDDLELQDPLKALPKPRIP